MLQLGVGVNIAKTAVKWTNTIGFWIFKCIWNCIIEMFQLGRGLEGSFLEAVAWGMKESQQGALSAPLSPLKELERGGLLAPQTF